MSEANGVPKGWVTVELGKILPIQYGEGLTSKKRMEDGNVQVFGSNGVVGQHDKALTSGPTLIIGRKGAAGVVHYSAHACWPIDTAYYAEQGENHDLRYFYFLLRFLRLDALDKSTAIPSLSRDDYNAQVIPLAPLNEQRRIVAKIEELFSDLDAGVVALNRAKANLKRYRAAVLKAAVEGKLTAEWRAKNPKTESALKLLERTLMERRKRWETDQLAKFAEAGKKPPKNWKAKYVEPLAPDTTDLPPVPDSWTWTTLDAIASVVGGITKDQKKADQPGMRDVPYLRVANVQRGYLDLSEMKTISASEADIADLRLEAGDVLFTEGGDRDKLGRGWVWSCELPECIHQNHIFRGRLISPQVQPRIVSHHGNTFGREWFTKAGKQTTNLASINLGILRRFPVPLAPFEEQAEIAALVDEKLSQIDAAEAAINADLLRATRLRQSILKQAFRGKLVPQDPNDESASILLEQLCDGQTANKSNGKAPTKQNRRREATA